jgi:hypothetical protein
MPVKGLTPEQIAAETAKQVAAGIKSTSKAAKLEGETYAEANARLTAGYKAQPKPELTEEGKALNATIQFVRSGSGGIGTYKEVYGIGTPIPTERTTAYGNVYDAQGNLISGSGLKTVGSGTTSVDVAAKNAAAEAKIRAEETAKLIARFKAQGMSDAEAEKAVKKFWEDASLAYQRGYEVDENGNQIPLYGSAGSGFFGTSTTSNSSNFTTSNNSTGAPTTNIDVLKAALKGMGFSSTIVESSTSFLNGLIRDGLDYDNATEIFLNNKEYTLKNGQKITSPFYTEYGYLNEGLTVPKTANELFNTVEGFKGVAEKYKLSSKYLTQDALKAYVKNDVTVADLAERAGTAQLRALEADPFQVNALIKQGFISSAADLADFYLDPKIGKEQLELNRQTGVFTAEALRRAKSGISTSAAQLSGFKQLTATLAAKGYSEAQIAQLAGQGFENISETLQPTTQLAQIYEKAGGTVESNAALTENIQSSLLQEEFMGTASERRKRLSEQNIRAFQGSAGTTTGSLRQANVLGIL